MKMFFKTLSAILFGVFISIIIAEVLISRLGVVDTPPGMLMPSHTRSFKHSPFFKGRDRFGNALRFNSQGLRDKEYPLQKGDGVYRILVLGDSVAFGDGIKVEDTFSDKLELILKEKVQNKTVEVLNSGVRGYNTYQELLLLKEIGLSYDPDLVIVSYVLNDAEPFSQQRGLIDPKHKFLIKLKNTIRKHSYLYAYFRRSLEIFRHHVTPDEFVERYDDQFDPQNPGWIASKNALKEMKKISIENGFDLLLSVLPRLEGLGEGEIYPPQDIHEQVVRTGLKLNIDTLDLLPAFMGRDAESLRITPTDTFHPTPEGHEMIARVLAEHIRKNYLKDVD